jgi:hypothetical protein
VVAVVVVEPLVAVVVVPVPVDAVDAGDATPTRTMSGALPLGFEMVMVLEVPDLKPERGTMKPL